MTIIAIDLWSLTYIILFAIYLIKVIVHNQRVSNAHNRSTGELQSLKWHDLKKKYSYSFLFVMTLASFWFWSCITIPVMCVCSSCCPYRKDHCDFSMVLNRKCPNGFIPTFSSFWWSSSIRSNEKCSSLGVSSSNSVQCYTLSFLVTQLLFPIV